MVPRWVSDPAAHALTRRRAAVTGCIVCKGGANDVVEWRLKLPLSLSYDHRVINGADAARFVRTVAAFVAEPEKALD